MRGDLERTPLNNQMRSFFFCLFSMGFGLFSIYANPSGGHLSGKKKEKKDLIWLFREVRSKSPLKISGPNSKNWAARGSISKAVLLREKWCKFPSRLWVSAGGCGCTLH